MPELPEVEIAVRRLRAAVTGRVIARVHLFHVAVRRTLSAADLRLLEARTVVEVARRGKHQLIRLDDSSTLHAHFRMAGDWHVGRTEEELPRHTRAVIAFADGTRIGLVDPRALSTLVRHAPDTSSLPELGVDADDPAFDADWLRRALVRRPGPIKPVLLDQRVVAGLGNIYAAEALWRAGIDPTAPASSLGPPHHERLVRAVRETLAAAFASPGRYGSSDTTDRMSVYGRRGEPCPRCGDPIRRIVQSARSTYYCSGCQKSPEQRPSRSPRGARP